MILCLDIFLYNAKVHSYDSILYNAQRLDIHSYDDLLFYKMCTVHLPSFPYLYSDSTEILSSPRLLSTLPQLDLYAYIDFTLTTMLLARPQLDSRIFVASKDTSTYLLIF
jgi:hypothetical protein